ncbi:acyl-CoA dehydrogenase family protein [Actinokineospora auranticolor]|uniref:Alkylation response protein AidB-like acyl-CoA dehydrogenase n=1 Tax=Actinokineospora auranticolor TaxID=155976 RepID=A0A2S6GBM5_9PSEU|nr:acyl-CoA dehydrogenase family protein [Actinokineospora auranticolor]PPK61345.1 hypothetical protein CLV40_14218 [Actinokineospora auranticolor]
MGAALAVLNRLAGASALDRFGLRKPVERGVHEATRVGFTAAGRVFTAVRGRGVSRLPDAPERGLFDLTPTDEQRMIRSTVEKFAAERVRPAAAAADAACAPPVEVVARAAELGVSALGVPEALGGLGTERSAVTNALVAEALAHGDLGLAVACLAPSAVGTALALWGDADQQATYLPAFTGENVPVAALAVQEPGALFDPFSLRTRAYRTPGGFVLDGVKSLVPRALDAELFVVAADVDGRGPALFLVEAGTAGITVEPEPAMGLRAAGTGRVRLARVSLPASAVLTGDYAECVRLSRIAWSALAVGTGQAVVDYVIPYVNDRVAFGEPVSHRQGVAFKVADMATELAGMRLLTYRAAALAEQGKPFAREAALARRQCAEHGMRIGDDGVQLLGGHGFVKEHPVERWYRDLRAVGVVEGIVLV